MLLGISGERLTVFAHVQTLLFTKTIPNIIHIVQHNGYELIHIISRITKVVGVNQADCLIPVKVLNRCMSERAIPFMGHSHSQSDARGARDHATSSCLLEGNNRSMK